MEEKQEVKRDKETKFLGLSLYVYLLILATFLSGFGLGFVTGKLKSKGKH